jgi:hypothetical protein
MKIEGPKPGAPGAVPPGREQGPDRASRPAGKAFAEELGAPRAGGASETPGTDALTADIAADLHAGKLDAQAAVERLVERVIDQQLGADAPAPVREKLRAALQEALASDPYLVEKLRQLG